MTKIYDFKENIDNNKLEEIAQEIRNGKIVIFPTETVYGIGANALDKSAVAKIFSAKGRPSDNPLIVHLSSKEMISTVAENISQIEQILIDNFMPGPLTIILRKKESIPQNVTGKLETVGVRIPANRIAQELIRLSGVPIAAPSANISGKPSGTNISDIKDELFNKVDYIIDGGNSSIGVESTVVKVENDVVKILRPGKITLEDISNLGLKAKLDSNIFKKIDAGQKVESPGMKHRHYAPNAKTVLVNSEDYIKMISKIKEIVDENYKLYDKICVIGFDEHRKYFKNVEFISFGSVNNLNEVSKNIFKTLRLLDKNNCEFCVIEGVEKKGIGIAITNRLIRACEYNVISVK